ncbi:MAG: ATP synthase F1 subunit epsilon [Chlorobium sp.]|jgi:F-type H+-transporting ATPase subunit epsilon|nr:ATP synthase F1 subunit epsilon [Chlorobium sp.]
MANSDKSFQIEIVTPQKIHFSGEVVSVTAPGELGQFQIMRNHAPLLSSLTKGKVKLALADNTEQSFSILDGFFEVSSNKAILLTESIS